MAKMKKFPKAPKASASVETFQRYEDRCKAVVAFNKALKEAPKKKAAIKERVAKLKAK